MKPEESFIQQPIRDLQTMLRVLARDRQILYMTCSESRTPK